MRFFHSYSFISELWWSMCCLAIHLTISFYPCKPPWPSCLICSIIMLTDSDDALWIRFHVICRHFLVHQYCIVNEATAVSLFHPIHPLLLPSFPCLCFKYISIKNSRPQGIQIMPEIPDAGWSRWYRRQRQEFGCRRRLSGFEWVLSLVSFYSNGNPSLNCI